VNDKTGAESDARAQSEPATSASSAEEPRRNIGRHAARLLTGAALLSTTALLPAFEAKLPPYQGD
jgi:hypothetical protein